MRRAWARCLIGQRRPRVPADWSASGSVPTMNVPDDLRYSTDHEWVRIEGANARIGITDYAQDALGDVVYVQVPEMGSTTQTGAVIGEVESTKSVSEIYAPLSGTITEVNTDLEATPELVNSDPYGSGWLAVIELEDASAVDALMDAAGYRQLTEG